MQDHRADVYILTWTRKIIGNGPSFQTIPVCYDYAASQIELYQLIPERKTSGCRIRA